MPELPEVETICRRLARGEPMERGAAPQPSPLGHAVTGVWTDTPRAAWPSFAALARHLPGRRIASIFRRGKYVVIAVPPGRLLIHLKMSGRLCVADAGEPRAKHTHFAFALDDGREIRFQDARRFGRVFLTDDPDTITGRLGPEPLEPAFTPAVFCELLGRRSGALKPLLLDQTFVAGIGNIYADEILWRARLHPRRRAGTLDPKEARTLHRAIRAVLAEGVRYEGTAIDWVYPGGGFQDRLHAYGRTKEPCRRCGATISRILVAQRGTHFCPCCQRIGRRGGPA